VLQRVIREVQHARKVQTTAYDMYVGNSTQSGKHVGNHSYFHCEFR